MAPREIERVSKLASLSTQEAAAYFKELLRSTTADGILLYATDVQALMNLFDHAAAEINELKRRDRR